MKVAVIYGSTRENGNTEALTEKALEGISADRIFLKDYQIKNITDQRHEPGGFDKVVDDYDKIIETVLKADVLIFATPIYWYGMASPMKTFVDRWSQTLKDARYPNFKESMGKKAAYILAVGGDDPRTKGIPLVEQFKYICAFIGMNYQGHILGEGGKPEEILNDVDALEEARKLNEKLKPG
ncbi:flavodoxin family protein [Thalassobacillus pellis]|uniref:flavodoxin family protein n=1 Tax=Thalassobacillus pellis TaxID=748008 RepID=UPI001961A89B|nr:flavodoxin family protein [Thalassobacillus pellis]MBM7553467.1 multimeric flavodoxin WrbA [Thalassobacillus pellis]